MSIATRYNINGTMADVFRIGKIGPTILQGSSVPNNSLGNVGDLYVQYGATPKLYVKQTFGWLVSGDPSFGFSRQVVTTGDNGSNVAAVQNGVNYVAVQQSTAISVAVPSSPYIGQQLTVKDESGTAGSNTITVVGSIDGQSSWNIDINYGVLNMVYGSTQWNITSAITSGQFNQVKL